MTQLLYTLPSVRQIYELVITCMFMKDDCLSIPVEASAILISDEVADTSYWRKVMCLVSPKTYRYPSLVGSPYSVSVQMDGL